MANRGSRSRCHYYYCTAAAVRHFQQSFSCFSVPSIVERWAWQYHMQHVSGTQPERCRGQAHSAYEYVLVDLDFVRWNSKEKKNRHDR